MNHIFELTWGQLSFVNDRRRKFVVHHKKPLYFFIFYHIPILSNHERQMDSAIWFRAKSKLEKYATNILMNIRHEKVCCRKLAIFCVEFPMFCKCPCLASSLNSKSLKFSLSFDIYKSQVQALWKYQILSSNLSLSS